MRANFNKIFFVIFFVCITPQSFSMDYTKLNSVKVLMSGEIKQGDAEKLVQFLLKMTAVPGDIIFTIDSPGRGCKVLVLCQERGAKVRIPILGSIPQLIKAIDSVHKMKAA